jgi:peptidoglycan/xylan/chitin deacetylase (PgdA/CDA1 family)
MTLRLSRRGFLRLGGAAIASISLPRSLRAKGTEIPVLLYHDISDDVRDEYTVSPSLFSAQMEWLYGSGFRAVSVSDLERPQRPGRTVVITFDDGYASFMDYAFPLFREYGFKATVNVIGRYVGGVLDANGPKPMLSWDEYRHLVESGLVEIGCHSHDLHAYGHRGVLGVSDGTVREDLLLFRETAGKETGRDPDILAWPYGLYDGRKIRVAADAGFRYLLTSNPGGFKPGGDLSEIPRRNVHEGTGLLSFRKTLGEAP